MTEQSNIGIKISVLTCNGAASGNVAGTEFGTDGGTIGNGAGNTLVLPDDTGGVAAHHADIRCVAGGWRMRNISERGALTVNGKPLMPGGDMSVGVGDFIGLGPYVLRVAPGLVAPDWQAGAAPARMDGVPAASALDGPSQPHREAGPLSEAPSAGWRPDDATLLESPIAFGDLTDLPVDPLALFGSVSRAWPGAHNPQAADLFGEEVGPTSRADEAPPPLAPRPHEGERRKSTELNSAFTMSLAMPMPERHDEVLPTGADGATAITPLSREAFEAHDRVEASHHPATAHATDEQPANSSLWDTAAEHARVPMKVRYDTHFGTAWHDATSAAPRRHDAGALLTRSAAHLPPAAADDRFASLRAAFPMAGAAARSEDSTTPAPVDVIASLASHSASRVEPLPSTLEGTGSALIGAFLAGAGIAAHDAAAVGLDTEFMYALGGMARTLLGRHIGSS
ncbi:MAG TPA: hypothetical protein VJS30_27560 [Paraburkholderia sp.]|nr:hypothetical protein [Paraburkholderia sp.]